MLIFLEGMHIVSLEWSLVGMGMRLALDIGAHLNSTFAHVSPIERELWKRAFWCGLCPRRLLRLTIGRGLFVTDQMIGVGLGREGVIPPEE